MVPVEVQGIHIEESTGSPVLLLRETNGVGRLLPVFIGHPEALSIALGLQHVAASRPLSADLLIDVLQHANLVVERVDVTGIEDGAFLAELQLGGPSGVVRVSSRPSDAIAVAVRADAPVFVSEALLDAAGVVISDAPSDDEIDEAVTDFRAFLEGIDPSDFAA